MGLETENRGDGAGRLRSPSGNPQISVLLVYPDALIREGIGCLLRETGFRVVAQTDSLGSLRSLVRQHGPDIVLVDPRLVDTGKDSVQDLLSDAAGASVALLTDPESADTLGDVIQAGATGYLSVSLSVEEFVHALHLLAGGSVIISGDMADNLQEELTDASPAGPGEELSDREREVLGLVAEGATNREIAKTLTVTENTVKVHLRRIMEKLDVRNRQQAVAFAFREGLVPDSESEDHS